MHSRLRGFCFLFAVEVWNQRDVDKGKVVVTHSELELSHGFYERSGLNVAYSAPELEASVKYCTIVVKKVIPQQCKHRVLHQTHLLEFWLRVRSNLGSRS